MYRVTNHNSEIIENKLFPSAKEHFLFDFELSKSRLLEKYVQLPCYVVLEKDNITEVIEKFPKEGEITILAYIDKGPEICEQVINGEKNTIEVVNRCDVDFALLYQPINVVEFLLHLHQGSKVESLELINECEIYHSSINEWFFNHKNFFKYNEFFHQLEEKIMDRYTKLRKKGSKIKLLNCDGKPLTFVNRI
ncbi:hypothetical protein HZA97_07065 [Candidatus Woesearchaeota archaeon]|nr:hypothetical protein [Candidatus Woesearchaeota archaeon]